ncbi:carnitine dehydratase [Sphingorhabdus lutea]|uniref:Carnitine dehydratase n=1 Tax=Sphingorhabdus lutea TaxID=1913578 RepID=A0A1L3J9L1_9SPHN|nr:CoA transferase [Sphingorhabdus lutea]APG61832.1 carnitine dehydratase [Sphingorhabdus lutea]
MAKWPKLKWDKEPTGPLKGVKIVDMATVVLGPFATMHFADLGAEVIKIENSQGNTPGDLMRHAGQSPTGDLGPIFTALNRNKKAINLNAKISEDRDIIYALLEDADVFFHNVRLAGMARLGLDYESVKAINPNIIYVHCAGYGMEGQYASRQAYDDLIQCASGFASLFEMRDGGRPVYMPSLIADKTVGLFASNATMAALFHRERTGEGQFVQVPMFETFTFFNMVENLWGETFVPGNGKYAYTRSINPNRRPYPTKDGFIGIVPYNDKQWARFFELGGMPGIFDDPRFSTYGERTKHISELYALIEQISATKSSEEWLNLLDKNDIPAMRYNRMEDMLSDPHLSEIGFFEQRSGADIGTYRSMKHPVHYSKTPANIYANPPQLDRDGDEIKTALGLGENVKK